MEVVGRRVLMVEDEPLLASSLARVLAREGLDVTVAGSYGAACSLLAAGRAVPDLLLLNLGSPGGCGAELIAVLRGRDPGAKIVVVSGQMDELTALRLQRQRVYTFLKPIQAQGLCAAVAMLLEEDPKEAGEPAPQRGGGDRSVPLLVAPPSDEHADCVRCDAVALGTFCIDRECTLVLGPHGLRLLTETEGRIFHALLTSPTTSRPRAELCQIALRRADDGAAATLRVHLCRMRGKLAEVGVPAPDAVLYTSAGRVWLYVVGQASRGEVAGRLPMATSADGPCRRLVHWSSVGRRL